jgi:hypothetical protein
MQWEIIENKQIGYIWRCADCGLEHPHGFVKNRQELQQMRPPNHNCKSKERQITFPIEHKE